MPTPAASVSAVSHGRYHRNHQELGHHQECRRSGCQGAEGKSDVDENVKRTQRDISFKIIAIGSLVTILVTFLFFWFGVMEGNLLFAIIAILLVAAIAFLFTTVAANAIAIVGSNPVSGEDLMTLIFASVVMVAVGLKVLAACWLP